MPRTPPDIDSRTHLSYILSGCMMIERSDMATPSIKEDARRLVEKLPDNSTWDDLVHEIYVRQAIEAGLADSQSGRTTAVEQVRASFGLPM